MKTGGSPSSCEIFTDGEVEDYSVNFVGGNGAVFQEKELNLEIYPNPAKDVLNVVATGSSEIINIKVYNLLGQIMDNFNVKNGTTTLQLDKYPRGILYIGADDGVKTALKKFIKE